MTSYYETQEQQGVEDYLALFSCMEDVHRMYEDCPPLLEAIFESCPSANSDYPLEEDDFFNDSISPHYGEVVCSTNSIYEEEHLPYNNWRNWCSNYDSSLAFGFCWDSDSFYHGNGADDDQQAGGFEKTEQPLQSEMQGESYSYNLDSATTEFSSDDHPWYGYESWFGCPRERDSHYHGNQEQEYTDSYSREGMEFFQGIIGYWPCLMGRHQGVIYAE